MPALPHNLYVQRSGKYVEGSYRHAKHDRVCRWGLQPLIAVMIADYHLFMQKDSAQNVGSYTCTMRHIEKHGDEEVIRQRFFPCPSGWSPTSLVRHKISTFSGNLDGSTSWCRPHSQPLDRF
ncbi:hypothetical protein MPTK1_7g03690 [Marchantia polymorpha subsp. ruderalis]|uniref:Uncharacterized protein n=2 Tax=Marchantia polymorpha TaxID=3197 RepID=A0AAF6BVU6_MARPO|nr:hypothetical protein MARPO_0074s0028 [Marchantia polymorpha]BBN16130.1 hypothetical protein Mp_7g03690 [Marchantia polymorpha subsp. ruderalis]|eukprot:PTQ35036.1 hypothetical protein MARPO_0074s0028 [Marchantia polymorpha]